MPRLAWQPRFERFSLCQRIGPGPSLRCSSDPHPPVPCSFWAMVPEPGCTTPLCRPWQNSLPPEKLRRFAISFRIWKKARKVRTLKRHCAQPSSQRLPSQKKSPGGCPCWPAGNPWEAADLAGCSRRLPAGRPRTDLFRLSLTRGRETVERARGAFSRGERPHALLTRDAGQAGRTRSHQAVMSPPGQARDPPYC